MSPQGRLESSENAAPPASSTGGGGFPNDEQRRVIEHLEGAALVLAPAGSGKTRVMAARLAAALEAGMPPSRTLCVTFTNRAAAEMRRRVEDALGAKARESHIFTFHGLCAWILRREAEDLGFPPDFVIYDEHDSADLLEEVAREQGTGCPFRNFREFFFDLSSRKSNLPAELLRLGGVPAVYAEGGAPSPEAPRIAEQYHGILEDRNALDFADLIYRVRAMLHLLPEKRARWSERFDWTQVDEVQDTHFSEYDVIRHLAGRRRNLAFFGDVDQTIYEWRGSKPDEILRLFRREFAPVRDFVLTRNYRSTRTLLTAADRFAASFGKRRTSLLPDDSLPKGESIVCQGARTTTEEAAWVAATTKGLLRARPDGKGTGIAVLARTNGRAQGISEVLTEEGVPHVTVEEFEFFRRQEIKDALARLRLILNPADSASLHRLLLRPASGVGEKTFAKISAEGLPFALRPVDLLFPRTHRTGEPFAALLDAWETGNLVVLDVETTGLVPSRDEVVEVAAARVRKGQVVDTFQRFLRPSLPVGDSEGVHGLSDAFLREKGEEPGAVFRSFGSFLAGAHLAGHNVRFDLSILRHHGKRLRCDLPLGEADDTLPISRRLVRADRHDLGSLAAFLKLPYSPKHRAEDDVYATVGLLCVLVPELARGQAARAGIVAKQGAPFVPIAERVERWRAQAERERPPALLERVLDESGLRSLYRKEPGRLGHLEELREYFRRGDRTDIDSWTSLEELTSRTALARNVDHLDPDDPRIPIITVHQAKGLEFDTVFVAGATEDEFPTYFSRRDGKLEEERRLFYVAITRPRCRLYVTWHETDDRGYRKGPSPFLRDLGAV